MATESCSASTMSRVFSLGVAFVAGCLFTLFFNSPSAMHYIQDSKNDQLGRIDGMRDATKQMPSSAEKAAVMEQAPPPPTIKLPPVKDTLPCIQGSKNDQPGRIDGMRDGTKQMPSSAEKAAVMEQAPPPPTIKLPPVKDTLPISRFGNSWKEDPNLQTLRKFGVVENIPDMKVLKTYDVNKLSAIYHRKLRMGQVGNCGWEICDDYEWRPITPCVIYSFGINYEFSFDDDAGRIYGCDVYSFDPSMSKQPTYRRSERVMFYRLGIGGQSGEPERKRNGWVLHSLSNFRAMLNHTHTIIDVLKMDVEQAEWSSLATMLKEGQLRSVRQLLVEYHQMDDEIGHLLSHLQIIGEIERAGFKKFYITKNKRSARNATGIPIIRVSCYEVHYVNARLRRMKNE